MYTHIFTFRTDSDKAKRYNEVLKEFLDFLPGENTFCLAVGLCYQIGKIGSCEKTLRITVLYYHYSDAYAFVMLSFLTVVVLFLQSKSSQTIVSKIIKIKIIEGS